MSDDFGTINVSQRERAKEIEAMRERFRRHRQAIEGLLADAPSEQLAQHYTRVVSEIDASLVKLDDLEARPEPGMRPLVSNPQPQHDYGVTADRKPGATGTRVLLILLVAFVGLAALGWFIWKASDRKESAVIDTVETAPVTTETNETVETTTSAADTIAPAGDGGLVANPQSQDYGVIRKGTRAVRKFTIRNDSDQTAALKVSRSACRCLYYAHPPTIAAKKDATLTITVDGAKAKTGALRESIEITTKDPNVKTSVNVIATVR